MRSGPNTRRPMRRGGGGNNNGNNNNGGRRGGSPRNQNFESNGPDVKVRGNAQQIVDKYQALAREAATAGNPVMAENYYQHAEHYFRVMTANGGGENRHGNRQPDGDMMRQNNGALNGNGQPHSNGYANQDEAQANGSGSPETQVPAPVVSVSSSEATDAPEADAAPDIQASAPETVGPANGSVGEAGDEPARKTERKRGPRGPRGARAPKTADEPIIAEAGEPEPEPAMVQPVAENEEEVAKAAP